MTASVRNIMLAAWLLLFNVASAWADEELLKPFVLASKSKGVLAEKVESTKAALLWQGFTIAGVYAPYPSATIIVVTDSDLLGNAAQSEHGGFGAMQRVAVVKAKDEIQVSYTNPVYMAQAYRMKGDLETVAAKLAAALGKIEEFGAKGLSARQLRKYHYMLGMEYFDEPSVLAEYGSFEEAAKVVEAGLAAGKSGVTKVYRIDLPEKTEAVFGVAMKVPGGGDKNMDDEYIMSEIDFKDLSSAAHLPYEILVSGNKVYALYARFRIATSFPDLAMMGKNSFMNIMGAPEAIRKALAQTAGGK